MLKPGFRVALALVVLALSLLVSFRPSPTRAQSQGDFVTVQGGQLMFKGKPVKLKGVNFYPKDQPWADMWEQWNGAAARQDLSRVQELGANTIRVLVPYEPNFGWTNKTTGQVEPVYLNELKQLVQMAGEMNLKVIISLFDFYDLVDDKPSHDSAAEARNLLYLQGIVPAFANDDRVLAWDLHNEPDQYTTWKDNRDPATVVAWLDRMAAEVRRLDPNHLLTVGMSQYNNLFVADATGAPPLGKAAPGRTVADISDFLSFHSYNAGNIDWQIAYIKDHSSKPLVLEETGWPTGPVCTDPTYSEKQQTYLYNLMVKGAQKGDLSGMLMWQLWDFRPGASMGAGRETNEDFYGLLRRDGSWKPAMTVFRDGWPGSQSTTQAVQLPSRSTSSLPLTVQPPPAPPTDPEYVPPIYFPETGHYIYGAFQNYWKSFGGLTVFGYPVTEQREEGDYWVQYFERARFEYHPENQKKTPGWATLDKPTQLKLLVQLSLLGDDLVNKTAGPKGYPAVDPAQAPPGATYFPETRHTISGKIAEYWQANNGLTNFGYPISEPMQEVSKIDGKTYTVQYFERTRLELHPENQPPYDVLLGLMGRELLASKGCK
ncbi:MAG: cellulase family glycosylhydrolase [Chloroflexi bacterium]|nr:cellulase family glycosylhydrolase [Chloroflexota bacterium]